MSNLLPTLKDLLKQNSSLGSDTKKRIWKSLQPRVKAPKVTSPKVKAPKTPKTT